MPKVKTSRLKYPQGWEVIEPYLEELNKEMRTAENDDSVKRKNESLWSIYRIHHKRTRFIYEMYYKKKKINREVYDFCIRNQYADAALIAKWKKEGYERLCCLRCIQTKDTNFGTTCICRVPKEKLAKNLLVECVACGCRGCSSGDGKIGKSEDTNEDEEVEQDNSNNQEETDEKDNE